MKSVFTPPLTRHYSATQSPQRLKNHSRRSAAYCSSEREREMGAVTTAVIAIVGLVLGWAAIEIACKPCLEKGREAIDRSLNPDYDPDDDDNNNIRAPLNPNPPSIADDSDAISTSSPSLIKAV